MSIYEALEAMDREFQKMTPEELKAYFDSIETNHEFDELDEMREFVGSFPPEFWECFTCLHFKLPADSSDFEQGKCCHLCYRRGLCGGYYKEKHSKDQQ